MGNAKSILNQSVRIPAPLLTEENLPDQTGKAVLITGGYTGLGRELHRILYQKNATIYILGRSPTKAAICISETKALFPSSTGKLEFIEADLADLTTVKGAVGEFLRKEKRLDVLVNNAGLMSPPAGSMSAQGHELQMATHALGHHLLTTLLLPILNSTSKLSSTKPRVLWAGSMVVDLQSPPTGIAFTTPTPPSPVVHASPQTNYAQSKGATLHLAVEFGKRHGDAVTSVCFNPGSLDTELLRHTWSPVARVARLVLLHPPVYGAYVELSAGWGEEAEKESVDGKGWYGIPWGRDGWSGLRADVLQAIEEGSVGERVWEWCERETKEFR